MVPRARAAASAPRIRPPSTVTRTPPCAGSAEVEDLEPRDRRDRRQRLAAKTEGRDVIEIVGGGDLRGRVPLEGEQGIVGVHAAAVVGHPDQAAAAVDELDLDPAGLRRRGCSPPAP